MNNQSQKPINKVYDLQERTLKFSRTIIDLCKSLPDNTINRPLINQLVRAATSIGANYCEADGAESKRDFLHKISICKKESKETKYWLDVLAHSNPDKAVVIKEIWRESQELTLIFSSIAKNSR